MSIERVHNFNAGPAAMPLAALDRIRDGMMGFGGMSILEISHRGNDFGAVIDEARDLLKRLMGIPDSHDVLFLQGGAAHQFAMVPLNLLDGSADYLVTGHWSQRALAEASVVGDTRVGFTSESSGFSRVPGAGEIKVGANASYVHMTTNNTIFGTQYREMPDTGKVPLVADMSSDILSRRIDVGRFGLIYAGAQKNLGPAGVTAVIMRRDLMEREPRQLPKILRYKTHAEKGSLYNTPPVFAIFAMMHCLRWVDEQGGVDEMERLSERKAAMLYDAIDGSDIYEGTADKHSRSRMNVTFRLLSEELTDRFVDEAGARGIVGIRGHRNVGGIRASIYNAVPMEAVSALAALMEDFRRKA